MKIYYIANARMPNEKAHGIQLAKMCEALIGEGIELELILPRRENTITETIESFYGLKKSISVTKLPVLEFPRHSKLGFNLASFTFALAYFFYLASKRLRGEHGIIYTIDLDKFSFVLIPLLGLPSFIEMHSTKEPNWSYRFFLKRARGIFAIRKRVKDDLVQKFNLDPERLAVAPNGIDIPMFDLKISKKDARVKLNLPVDARVAMYIGKFFEWKGLGVLLDLAKRLRDKTVIYLVGGTLKGLSLLVGTSNLPPNIICFGERSYKEMPLWLKAADVLLLLGTKSNDYSYTQTSPMKLFEYMTARRPIVASRTPANEEVISESEVFFYEPDNAEDLANQIKRLLENPELGNPVINRAFDKALKYSWENRAEAVLNFIKSNL